MKIETRRIESDVFTLYPGVVIDGQPKTECVVTLLTRDQVKDIQKEPEGQREDMELMYSIVRLGDVTDPTFIGVALGSLMVTDEIRIRQAVTQLQAECLTEGAPEPPTVRRIMPEIDLVSEPFALNPGVFINGQWQRTCSVRLLHRGEWKQIQAEPDPINQDDLSLYLSIVQLGNCTAVELAHVDQLTGGDVDRINEAIEELRAQYAPGSKSEE